MNHDAAVDALLDEVSARFAEAEDDTDGTLTAGIFDALSELERVPVPA